MANPASDMTIGYDPSAAKITVTIIHPVDDPATHYLKTVRVMMNDRIVSDPEYKSQTPKEGFTSGHEREHRKNDIEPASSSAPTSPL